MQSIRNMFNRIASAFKRKRKPKPKPKPKPVSTHVLTREEMYEPCPKCADAKHLHIRLASTDKGYCLAKDCTCPCTEFFGEVNPKVDDVSFVA